jgi:hypothetical protein
MQIRKTKIPIVQKNVQNNMRTVPHLKIIHDLINVEKFTKNVSKPAKASKIKMYKHGGCMKLIFCIVLLLFASACSPLDSVVITDVKDEYVVMGRDTTPFVSQQHIAEENAIAGAKDFCSTLGKEYKKKYVVTTGMMPGKWADATLHFRCVNKSSANVESPNIDSNKSEGSSQVENSNEDKVYIKLTNLKKLLDNGTITKEEFDQQKAKILNQ